MQESELALFQGELNVAPTQLNPIGRVNFVKRGGVDAKRVQLVVGFTGGFFGRADTGGQQTEEPEEHRPEPHARV